MGIGKRIREARTGLGLTQAKLAELVGTTKGAIGNYENGTSHPKEPILLKLIETLKVDANFLFQDSVSLPKMANKNMKNISLEEQVKEIILERYSSMKEFSISIDMPYSTIDNIFKRGFNKVNISNLTAICRALNISLDALAVGEIAYCKGEIVSRYFDTSQNGQVDNVNNGHMVHTGSGQDISKQAMELAILFDELDLRRQDRFVDFALELEDEAKTENLRKQA